MADIFISYKREDRARIAPLARALEARGYTVWWDLELVAGQKWGKKIKAELDAAKCVIVVWTRASVGDDQTYLSEWVENEADSGHRRGILVPALLDEGRIAWTHQRVQFAELIGWRGEANHPGLSALIEGVTQYVGARARPEEIELAAWQNAERAETAQAFQAFLAAHPQSRFSAIAAGRAAELEEAEAWGALGSAPSISALAAFARRFPAGRFTDEAAAKLKTLEAEARRNEDGDAPVHSKTRVARRHPPIGAFQRNLDATLWSKRGFTKARVAIVLGIAIFLPLAGYLFATAPALRANDLDKASTQRASEMAQPESEVPLRPAATAEPRDPLWSGPWRGIDATWILDSQVEVPSSEYICPYMITLEQRADGRLFWYYRNSRHSMWGPEEATQVSDSVIRIRTPFESLELTLDGDELTIRDRRGGRLCRMRRSEKEDVPRI